MHKDMMKRRSADGGSEALEAALEAVEALDSLGLVVAPVDPTAAMVRAGAASGGVPDELAARIYRAMLACVD
ncbi:hypothetical protein [Oceanibaculum pacificum]|uniref:Uncharacterized protein n=1 Tax=Oceanibaculum pacificum TaxID=580166 RepID=A0A154V702_9PROT|nr:hypothetical protein [Oceanibaculum pacificum]KZC97019.1 hypothetical protein AUP43_15265 [Oceanibaculum pacificum]